ncbi:MULTISPECIES: lysine 2,3-aminomutase [Pseudothermotoga]|jgi:lysine 2,3-aminomutase|uniref:L-lysine 2,3-aminomutase n=3 Tax=Pseudothermotoga TaxID=1643951 RepID=A8F4H1_PSELT|nr:MULTISPECIES: lysine 2,3-aminomutase [Pseudothermotoga]ABV33055.1 lysine 2,3-aminomutase YodO family protein [Pseudothermotoga lettingae TMO]KUK22046.1 MAG: Lysine 2,3-aminomutase YodO family protein [Pseudothermotoga lettingae]MDI3494272.1 lysine 2,3-aminomutase [Pseudothermotoga sp.]MDK2884061.1 lysine 2,3-aminomutase [Pseudothermotoga sp.]GLI47943.1 L-lysine 2,3-aminomutase [Pseudothermotoga lettingae TMO]
MRDFREISLWKNVTEDEWNDWKWQLRNRIMNLDVLQEVVNLTDQEREGVRHSLKFLRMAITPYYATLMDPENPRCPIRMQAIPTAKELNISQEEMIDPLHEDVDSPVKGLTHRYPDRVLLLITDQCSMYCRHCTRRRFAGETDSPLSDELLNSAIDYIKQNKRIRDVLLSGGDPLTLSTEKLENIISRIREIEHVEIIRIGTRVPVVLPMRITEELTSMLKKYHPIWLNTHFNHPKEITPQSRRALSMLADAGIPLGNQSVLLRGINDCPQIMKKLVHELVKNRVRPYYIYQCDLSRGLSHFRTTVAKGIEIIEYLRGHTSGFAVPTYVIDAPGGGGKIPVEPQYLISMGEGKVVLRNYEGGIFVYHEPRNYKSECNDNYLEEERKSTDGIASLLSGERRYLIPESADRIRRIKNWHRE